MKWERRNQDLNSTARPGELPVDFLKLVEETLSQALESGLAEIRKIHPLSEFKASGAIFGDEVVLSITLFHGEQVLSATTIHGSVDYQPSQEVPSLNDLLALCLDTIGSSFQHYLDPEFPERVAQVAQSSMSALEEAPFEWTPLKIQEGQKITVHVKMDKSNPTLDRMAEEWLEKNDPNYQESVVVSENVDFGSAEAFLEERIDAIRAAKSGSGPGSHGGGPIRH